MIVTVFVSTVCTCRSESMFTTVAFQEAIINNILHHPIQKTKLSTALQPVDRTFSVDSIKDVKVVDGNL